MGALRKQMDGDLVVRGMSVRRREAYLGAVAGLAKHYRRRPDQITAQEVQNYLLELPAASTPCRRAHIARAVTR